ncbi:MAG: hypothetical protein RR520_06045 [Erysipelotrichaceae bacterium]
MKYLRKMIKIILLIAFLVFFIKQLEPYLNQSLTLLTSLSRYRLVIYILLCSLPYLLAGLSFTLLARHYHPLTYVQGIHIAYLSMFCENTLGSIPAKAVSLLSLHHHQFSIHESFTIVIYDFLNFQLPAFILSLLPFFPGNNFFFITYPLEIYPALLGACFNLFPLLLLFLLFSTIKLPPFILKLYHLLFKNSHHVSFTFLSFHKVAIHKYSDLAISLLLLNILRLFIRNALPLFAIYTLRIPIESNQILSLWLASIFLELLLSMFPFAGKLGVAESCFVLVYAPLINKVNAIGVMLLWRLCFYYLNTLMGALTFFASKQVSFHEMNSYYK